LQSEQGVESYWVEGFPLELAFQNLISGMNVFSFLAIPFFIYSGELMLHGGVADKIVTFARNMTGHWRGGLGMANVVACTMFGGVSGSPVADVSAMGGVMIPRRKATAPTTRSTSRRTRRWLAR
jgi:TRAP-type C4-dicarboxylate transport system permease large subunit